MTFFLVIVASYFLGSIPFGLLLTRAAGLGDIRKVGSGNIGATNVMRTGHKGLGAMTLLLDGGKGFAAVSLTDWAWGNPYLDLSAMFAVLGHIFPVWLRFRGGKGVATAIGVLLALNWMVGASVCAMWLVVFLFLRISSVAAMVSIGYAWGVAYLIDDFDTSILSFVLALLILYTHRENIRRLIAGNERGFRKEK